MEFNTPILLIIFNRPDTAKRVFDTIRTVRPTKLFIAADGPRENNPEDIELCRLAREIVVSIDWLCEVKTLFRDKNLGCGPGPVTAINWFFEHVEEGIVLEDDCLPDQSFFYFCQELLEHYRYNRKIMYIGGDNFQFGRKRGKASYYFSDLVHTCWGWATWRRAWKYNDFYLLPPDERGHIWDIAWRSSVIKKHGLFILPNVNLVTNIGSGLLATHTKKMARFLYVPTKKMEFPLVHPKSIEANRKASDYTSKFVFGPKIPKNKTIKFIEYQLKNILKKLNLFKSAKNLYLKFVNKHTKPNHD